MNQTEMIVPAEPETMITNAQAARMLAQMNDASRAMADAMRDVANMVRATNERMTALEKEVRLLTKVTGAQASEIGKAIRERAAALCTERKLPPEADKPIAAAIRREIRLTTGVEAVRDIPRCEYQVILRRVQLWDDYKAIKAIRAKVEARNGAKED